MVVIGLNGSKVTAYRPLKRFLLRHSSQSRFPGLSQSKTHRLHPKPL